MQLAVYQDTDRKRTSTSLAAFSLQALEVAVEQFAASLPKAFGSEAVGKMPHLRERVLQGALAEALSSVELDDIEMLSLSYLRAVDRRALIESCVGAELQWHLVERPHDLLFEIDGEIEHDIDLPLLDLSFRRHAPEEFHEHSRSGVFYAYVRHVTARSADDAIGIGRQRLETCVAILGIVDVWPVSLPVRVVMFLDSRVHLPGYAVAERTIDIGRAKPESWDAVESLTPLLNAQDELALRLSKALRRFHKALAASDPEDRFQESWQVLELLSGKATAAAAGFLGFLPLYFVPHDFSTMSTEARSRLMNDTYRTFIDQLETVQAVRNQRIIHPESPRMDVKVLGQHAEWILSFARTALRAAISAWNSGARSPTEIVRTLDRIYLTRFGLPLPRKDRMAGLS